MLQNLSLTNFRNHRKLDLSLGKITVLIGPNGAGKSNILEAISLLSSCRSFREDDKKFLINFESEYGRVQGDNLEVFIQREPVLLMQAKENGVFKKHSAFVGLLRSVIFSPETMSLATGSPKARRRFLDLMISQKDRDYLTALVSYEKIRTQRNSLLQRILERRSSEDELEFWDDGLLREGEIIAQKRENAIDFLNQSIGKVYREISGDAADDLCIYYQKNEVADCRDRDNRQKEIWQGRTLFGPHRDDIMINLNKRSIASFASRGEIRSAILALKIGELVFLQDNEENQPILLLDDIFSEFDQERRSHLGNLISSYQTVITTTDRSHLSEWLSSQAKIIEI